MSIAVEGLYDHPLPPAAGYAAPDVDCIWNVMAHSQKPDFVFRRNGRVHLNRRGCQFNRLLAAEVCASAVLMLDTPCSEVVRRVLATHSIRQFYPSLPFPCVTVCHHISTGLYNRIYQAYIVTICTQIMLRCMRSQHLTIYTHTLY